ncbi:MAG TPA: M1 family metallopeptidase [Woeseiaceae bacterium]
MESIARTLFAAGALLLAAAYTARATEAGYDPLETFAPFPYAYPANDYRAADGTPGEHYWQNRVDYRIDAMLETAEKQLAGTVTIRYRNSSPNALDMLWLQLDQNRYREDARGNFAGDAAPPAGEHTAGYRIASVAWAAADGGFEAVPWVVTDTRMRVDLPQPVPADGGEVRLRIVYDYVIPGQFGGRTDWFHTEKGDIYEIAQWFPRLCVYDDLRGWNTLPYLNNEFYLEYGDIDYRVTVPADMFVVGSGELVNPEEVLSETALARLAQARESDETVIVRGVEDVDKRGSRSRKSATRTWHFRMRNTRDVAFGASAAYIVDAARINLPSGRKALAMSAYPVESLEEGGWERSTEYVKNTVEYFSDYLYEYPYPSAIAEAGIAGGMEYPGIAFDWYKSTGKNLYGLTTHEVGHNWFPMIVGANERRDAWIDEGFNTFVDILAAEAFNGGEFAPKRDGEYAPGGGNPVEEIVPVLVDPEAPPILTRPDAIREEYRHPVTYFKSALGMVLLRREILGPERFDKALARFVRAWAFKHPSSADFFRAMESAAGEDLSWFWNGWYAHNWQLDLAVTDVGYVDDEPENGALVTVVNRRKMVLPSTLEVDYANGESTRVRVPAATWLQHREFAVFVPGNAQVKAAVIDPDHRIPDVVRANNRFLTR